MEFTSLCPTSFASPDAGGKRSHKAFPRWSKKAQLMLASKQMSDEEVTEQMEGMELVDGAAGGGGSIC